MKNHTYIGTKSMQNDKVFQLDMSTFIYTNSLTKTYLSSNKQSDISLISLKSTWNIGQLRIEIQGST